MKRIKNTYQREIERKPLNNIVFSVVLAGSIITATIVFGLVPIIKAVAQNTDYADQLTKTEIMMENKLAKIEENKQSIQEAERGIEILNEKIPTKPNFQVFLEQLVPVASNSQFVIRQAEKQQNQQSETESVISLILEGNIENLSKLVQDLENETPRFVSIETVKTQEQRDSEFDLVEIRMKVYTLK